VFPLRFGASTFLTERATPVEFAQHVHDSGATVISTAPTAYRAILREGKAHLLAGVRSAVSAGEPLPKATWEDVHRETGLAIIDGIGATEMLHIFISAAGDDIRPGATGRPVPGYRATVLDDDGNETPRGTPGRLAVVGPTGCRYLGGDPRQQLYVAHGWNITGDTYVQDEDGYFHFHSRTDNLIVSSGYNISGPEVESAVASHPDVVEVAVVGRPDDDRGNVVTAFVVLRDGVTGDDAKRKEIQDHVKQTIAPYKYPRDVRFVDSVPRNPSGKLQHYRLRKQLQDEARRRDAQAAADATTAAAPATTDHAR
jgi:2-aminobenzoate-CoA ligase